MIVVTTDTVPGREIVEVFGLVQGSTVRAKNVGSDILAGLINLVGGEMSQYTEMLEESRSQAMHRMISEAEKRSADAIVCCRLATSAVAQGAAEMLFYGTAVKLGPKK